MGVLLRFVVVAFTVVTLTLVAAVGVSAGSRGFGTPGGPGLTGELTHFFSVSSGHEGGHEGDNCPPPKHKHHKATKPHEHCDDGDANGD